jgi:hypothetical protein
VLEGLGAAHWLSQNGLDGADSRKIHRNDWHPALCAVYDVNEEHGLDALHQDQIGARTNIDFDDTALPKKGRH